MDKATERRHYLNQPVIARYIRLKLKPFSVSKLFSHKLSIIVNIIILKWKHLKVKIYFVY
jgi:hypothetical protein